MAAGDGGNDDESDDDVCSEAGAWDGASSAKTSVAGGTVRLEKITITRLHPTLRGQRMPNPGRRMCAPRQTRDGRAAEMRATLQGI